MADKMKEERMKARGALLFDCRFYSITFSICNKPSNPFACIHHQVSFFFKWHIRKEFNGDLRLFSLSTGLDSVQNFIFSLFRVAESAQRCPFDKRTLDSPRNLKTAAQSDFLRVVRFLFSFSFLNSNRITSRRSSSIESPWWPGDFNRRKLGRRLFALAWPRHQTAGGRTRFRSLSFFIVCVCVWVWLG